MPLWSLPWKRHQLQTCRRCEVFLGTPEHLSSAHRCCQSSSTGLGGTAPSPCPSPPPLAQSSGGISRGSPGRAGGAVPAHIIPLAPAAPPWQPKQSHNRGGPAADPTPGSSGALETSPEWPPGPAARPAGASALLCPGKCRDTELQAGQSGGSCAVPRCFPMSVIPGGCWSWGQLRTSGSRGTLGSPPPSSLM